jgi:phage terminase large subunit-like protein
MNFIAQYNEALQRGEIPACRRVKAIYKRLAADTELPGRYVFDEARANRPIEFIERFCRHSKGEWAGWPVRLELFQKAFIQALYGFVDASTGLRRFREAFFLVARKNGKSTLLAGLALYMLIADGEGGAEVYSTATKYAQARLLFDECHNMVKQSPHEEAKNRPVLCAVHVQAATAFPKFRQSGRAERVLCHHGRTARRQRPQPVRGDAPVPSRAPPTPACHDNDRRNGARIRF